MVCYLCESEKKFIRPGQVRDDKSIKIYECDNCGLVFLSKIDHITKDHYSESNMHLNNPSDIQKWMKETKIDDERRYNFLKTRLLNKNVIDFGCGTGGFIKLSQNFTNKIIGIEPEKALIEHFKQNNLEVYEDHFAKEVKEIKYDLITAFHVIEHLQNPSKIIIELAELLKDEGEIIIEVPSANDALDVLYKNKDYRNFKFWSQHLYLFTIETLKKLAKKSNLNCSWVKQVQRYSISNHLYWMTKGKPGGHEEWFFLDNKLLNQEYSNQLVSLGLADTLIASFKKK